MFQIFQKSGLVGVVLLVSACGVGFDFDALREQDGTDGGEGGNFSVELGRAYKKFALAEIDLMADWIDGAHFGAKAQLAFASRSPENIPSENILSKIPGPEKVENWWLTEDQKKVFAGARKRLIHILDRQSKNQLPKVAAAAQVNFDCWIEQQEENWQIAHIEKCRSGFYSAVERLEEMAALARSNYRVVPDTPSDRAQVMSARQSLISPRAPHDLRSYTLYFLFDKSAITKVGEEKIDRVVQAYRAGVPATIILAGHTDRSGKKPYNLNLSRLRSNSVRRALIERGVPVQMIAVQAFGESHPKMKTVDGMKEPLNRRVEITLGPATDL